MAYLAGGNKVNRGVVRSPEFVLLPAAVVLVAAASAGIHWLVTVAALAAVALLALVAPAMVVAGVVASIPVQSEVMLPFVRGELTVTQVMMFGLIAGWGVLFWRRRIWLDSVVVGFLLVLAAYAVSFIAVDNPGLWFQESYRWAIAGVFYVICRSVMVDRRAVRWSVWAMLVGVAGVSLMSLYQLASGSGPQDFLAGGAIRVYGSFGTPNTLAAYMELTILFLLACLPLAWRRDGQFQFHTLEKWAIIGVTAVGMLVVGLTQSRGGWIGLGLGLLVLWWQFPIRVKLVSFVVGVVLIGGFLLTPPGQSQYERFMELQDEPAPAVTSGAVSVHQSSAGRGTLWNTAVLMIKDRPLTGIGAGEFDENYREYVPNWLDRFPRGQAHNVWLQMGAQAGVWGILAYAAWYAASTWSIITARRRTQTSAGFWLVTGVIAVFVAYTAHSLVDYLNVLSLGLQLSVLTAIALNSAPEPLSRYSSSEPAIHSHVVPEPA